MGISVARGLYPHALGWHLKLVLGPTSAGCGLGLASRWGGGNPELVHPL